MASTAGPAPNWVQRLKAGDSDAWTQFYERYKDDFVGFAHHLVQVYGSKVDPEDLVHDGIVKMMEHIQTFDETRPTKSAEPLRAWGCIIIKRLLFDGGRREQKLPKSYIEDANRLAAAEFPDPAFLTSEQRKMLTAIQRAKETLTPAQRVKFELIYEQDVNDYKVLAKELGVKPESAKVMLSTFKKKFEQLAADFYKRG